MAIQTILMTAPMIANLLYVRMVSSKEKKSVMMVMPLILTIVLMRVLLHFVVMVLFNRVVVVKNATMETQIMVMDVVIHVKMSMEQDLHPQRAPPLPRAVSVQQMRPVLLQVTVVRLAPILPYRVEQAVRRYVARLVEIV